MTITENLWNEIVPYKEDIANPRGLKPKK